MNLHNNYWLLLPSLLTLAACQANTVNNKEENNITYKTLNPDAPLTLERSGAKAVFLRGSVTRAITVSLGEPSKGYPKLPKDLKLCSPVFEFRPHGEEFEQTVTLTLPYEDCDRDAVQLYSAADADAKWASLDAEVEREEVIAKRTSFSFFVVVQPKTVAPMLDSGTSTGTDSNPASTTEVETSDPTSSAPSSADTTPDDETPEPDAGPEEFDCTGTERQPGTTMCGPNDSGLLEQVCNDGEWEDTTECIGADDCTNDESRVSETACNNGGFNGNARLQELCTDGAWQTTTCVDSDVCVNTTTRVSEQPCGEEDSGFLTESCTAGQWQGTGECTDCGSVVHEGTASVTNQEQVDALAGVTWIKGALDVSGADVESVSALSDLRCVDGTFTIQVVENLTSLAGLEAVTRVGTLILSSTGVESLQALSGLTQVNNVMLSRNAELIDVALGAVAQLTALDIGENPRLTDLTGLTSLKSIGTLSVIGNTELASLAGLEGVTNVGAADLRGAGLRSLAALSNVSGPMTDLGISTTSLVDLDGLQGVTSVGNLSLVSNDRLTSVAELGSVQGRLESLNIESCTLLESLDGLDGVTRVAGNLSLSNLPLLTDAGALEAVTRVDGNLTLSALTLLAELSGFAGLTRVGGILSVQVNQGLLSLAGLGALTEVSGGVVLDRLVQLESLEGVDELSSIGGLSISDAPGLLSLAGISGVELNGVVALLDLDVLTDLEGFDNPGDLTSLSITSCSELVSLEGLGQLQRMDGGLTLSNLPALTDVTALSALTQAGGISLDNLESLESLEGLNELRLVGGLSLGALPVLQDLQPLAALAQASSISIWGVDAIVDLQGLGGLVEAAGLYLGDTTLGGLANLQSLNGLGAVTNLTDLFIIGTPALTDLSWLLDTPPPTNNLTLQNTGLTSLTDLQELTTLAGTLLIYENPDLTSLEGLNNLTTTSATNIWENPALVSLDGLDSLSSGALGVYQNAVLVDIDVLFNVTAPAFASLDFSVNGALPQCRIDELATYLSGVGWGGTVTSGSNDTSATCD